MKITKIQTDPNVVYEVDVQPFDWNEFLDWLVTRTENQMSVIAFNNIYVFRTITERVQFALGFQLAWDEFTGVKKRHEKGKKKPRPTMKEPKKVMKEFKDAVNERSGSNNDNNDDKPNG